MSGRFEAAPRVYQIASCIYFSTVIDDELLVLFASLSALELKWLVRIILRRVTIGLGARTILKALHPHANDIYARSTHLSLVCRFIAQPQPQKQLPSSDANDANNDAAAGLQLISIQPGRPFRPMLCEAVRCTTLEALLAAHAHVIETKLDGERFQLHWLAARAEFRYYSRRGHDYTAAFGHNAEDRNGSLSAALVQFVPHFRETRDSSRAADCILDGEMMVWDCAARRYRTKGEPGAGDVKALRRDNQLQLRPVFVAFDVLWWADACLTEKPWAERQRVLRELIPQTAYGMAEAAVLRRAEAERVRDVEHVVECVNRALDAREEGVVLKREDGRYVAGARTAGWCKVKADVSKSKNLLRIFVVMYKYQV